MPSQVINMYWSNNYNLDMTVNYEENYDPSTNKSTVTVTSLSFGSIMQSGTVKSASWSGYINGILSIAGTAVLTLSAWHTGSGTHTVSAASVEIAHNEDGSGSTDWVTSPIKSGYANFYISVTGYSNSSFKAGGQTSSYTLAVPLETHQRYFTLNVSADNVAVTVTRDGVIVANGSTVKYGDALVVAAAANAGYRLTSDPSGTLTVTGAVTIIATAELITYTLTINKDAHTTVTVTRTNSPNKGASSGTLANDDAVYYGDVLRVEVSTGAAYEIDKLTWNGSKLTSGSSKSVTGNVAIIATAKVLAVVHICDGSEFAMYLVEIYDGSWGLYQPYICNGSAWEPYM